MDLDHPHEHQLSPNPPPVAPVAPVAPIAHAAPVAPVQNSTPREPRLPVPDRFNGSRENFSSFLAQVETVFQLNRSRFPDDLTRILYIGSLLTGTASRWFEATIRTQLATLSYAQFLSQFRTLFSDPYTVSNARRKIRNLHQGSMSASSYIMKFLSLSGETGFNDNALSDLLLTNLKPEIKDVIATTADVPDTLNAFIDFIIGIDNRLYERKMETKDYRPARPQQRNQYRFQNTPQRIVTPGPDPMDLDNLQVQIRNDAPNGPRGPLSQQEKDRRRKLGLCLYCGKKGHIAITCPSKNAQGPQSRRI
jgi:hypothetical protein